jgi:hypothetical protein
VQQKCHSFLVSFGVSYNFVAQKWSILAVFHKKSIFGKLLGSRLEGIEI